MASVRSDRSMDRSVRKQYTPITEPVSPGIFPGSGSQDMADHLHLHLRYDGNKIGF